MLQSVLLDQCLCDRIRDNTGKNWHYAMDESAPHLGHPEQANVK